MKNDIYFCRIFGMVAAVAGCEPRAEHMKTNDIVGEIRKEEKFMC